MRMYVDTQWNTTLWGPVNWTSSNDGYLSMNLTNLDYANTEYIASITARTYPEGFKCAEFAENDDHFSKDTNVTFRTNGRIPDHAPQIDIGSFCIFSNGTVQLYAQSVPWDRKNGDNFEYVFEEIRHRIQYDVRYNVATYNDVTDADITFAVRSKNSFGESRSTHYIVVPRLGNRCPMPTHLKLLRTAGSRTNYYLAWQPPPKELLTEYCPQITSYTIVCCENSTFMYVYPHTESGYVPSFNTLFASTNG